MTDREIDGRDVDGGTDPIEATAPVSEQLKDRAMDEAPVGISITDHTVDDEPLIYVNEAFEQITGYAEDEILGRNCRFLQTDETDEDSVAEVRRAIEEDYPVQVTLRNERKDGEPFWNELTIAPIRDDDGVVRHFVGFQNDVTAREHLRRELDEERDRLDASIERIRSTLTAITDAVRRADGPRDVERTVVEGLAHASPWGAAWTGAVAPDGDAVTVTASVDGPPVDGRVGVDEPLPAALDADDTTVVAAGDWRAATDDADWLGDADAVAVTPIRPADGDRRVAVVAMPTTDVDHREIAVLDAIGTTAAMALSA